MESLYVCLFSNGHIKVGRSVDPQSRIATHTDRVACMGVELADFFTTETAGETDRREAMLIALCAQSPGATRFKSEWFSGLEFNTVVAWAESCSFCPLAPREESMWARVISQLKASGLSQTKIAELCECGQTTISDLGSGRARDPAHSLGCSLLALQEKHCGKTAISPQASQSAITPICSPSQP